MALDTSIREKSTMRFSFPAGFLGKRRSNPEGPSDGLHHATFTVGALAFCTLILELAISRLSVFYLDYGSSFLAIPLTLLGLAIGSLHVHLRKNSINNFNIRNNLLFLIIASFLAFATVFVLFSSLLPMKRNLINESIPLYFMRMVLFIFAFIPAFYVAGKILTVLFSKNSNRIGKIYAGDLLGASISCLITPFFFHFLDLPYLILFYFVVLIVCTVLYIPDFQTRLKAFSGLFILCFFLTKILISLESRYDLTGLVRVPDGGKAQDIEHRWNEYSRVSLLRVLDRNGRTDGYRIIHDNAESNVVVQPFNETSSNKAYLPYLPFLIKDNVSDVLVMFAGCGAQMIDMYNYTNGKANIDGVEINPLVKEFAMKNENLKDYRLNDFYNLPNVNLHVKEGRRFLMRNQRDYDIILAASDAATSQYKTGHSRKYLDTYEAMRSYVDCLKPDGVLMFLSKPAWPKLSTLKAVWEERGLGNFEMAAIVYSEGGYSDQSVWHHTIVKKNGFSAEEVDRITQYYDGKSTLLYAPSRPQNHPAFEKFLVHNDQSDIPVFYNLMPTDSKPYHLRLSFDKYTPFPDKSIVHTFHFFTSWMKIQTLLIVCAIPVLIFIALYAFTRRRMPPGSVFTYLLISGFCYMLVQIVFIGKLELFLENPLLSMALLISVFLLTNSLGSALVDTLKNRIPANIYPLLVAIVVAGCYALSTVAGAHLMGLHFMVKILLAVLIIAPVGTCLGYFYPYAVHWLNESGRSESIPVTYGISTLSSVMGATYAMTLIINQGYSNVLYQSIAGYCILCAFMFVAQRLK